MNSLTDKSTVRYTYPEGENVIDIWVSGTLHTDGVPFAESSKTAKSINIISFAIHECNPCYNNTRAFSIFLCTMSDTNTIQYKIAMEYITKTITCLGKLGIYFQKDGVWYHLRWYIQTILPDYVESVRLLGRGHQCSDSPCFVCNTEKVFYNPFLSTEMVLSWGTLFKGKTLKLFPSSMHMVNGQSRVKYCSLSTTELLSKGIDINTVKNWKSLILPTKVSQCVAFERLLSTSRVENFSQLHINTNCELDWKFSTNSDHLKKCGCWRKDRQPENNQNNSIMVLKTLLPRKGEVTEDIMYILSNCFIRICNLLDQKINKRQSQTYDSILSNFNPGLESKSFLLPTNIHAYASDRLSKLKGVSWIIPLSMVPKYFSSLTIEQKCVLFFNLFSYIFQDNQDNFVIRLLTKIIDIIGELYLCLRDYDRASSLQSKLSIYLGMLENNVVPTFPTTCVHSLNHLFHIITYSGPLCQVNNFSSERSYKTPKRCNTLGKTILLSFPQRERLRTLSAMLSLPEEVWIDRLTNLDDCIYRVSECYKVDERYIRYAMVDDYILFRDCRHLVDTYLDECMEEKTGWIERNKFFVDNLKVEAGNELKYYSSISYNKSQLQSYGIDQPNLPINKLMDIESCIGYTRGSNSKLYYFIIRCYVVAKWNEYNYPLAICSPIKVESMSEDCYTYYHLKINELNLNAPYMVISLRRLEIGKSKVLPYKNNKIYAVSPMVLNLYQFKCHCNDVLFNEIREYFEKYYESTPPHL